MTNSSLDNSEQRPTEQATVPHNVFLHVTETDNIVAEQSKTENYEIEAQNTRKIKRNYMQF